jgi:hypothetical protein
MQRTADLFRTVIGIREYTPGPLPRSKVRKKTRCGERSRNGYAPGLDGLALPTLAVIAKLAQQHRIIRQMAADNARRSSW